MSLHSGALFWFRANQFLLLLLNVECLAETPLYRVVLDFRVADYNTKGLTVDHIWSRAWRLPGFLYVNELLCRLQQRVGAIQKPTCCVPIQFSILFYWKSKVASLIVKVLIHFCIVFCFELILVLNMHHAWTIWFSYWTVSNHQSINYMSSLREWSNH